MGARWVSGVCEGYKWAPKPRNWRYRHWYSLGTQLWSSERSVFALDCCAVSLAPWVKMLIL